MLRKHNYWCFLTKLMNFYTFKNIFRYKFDKNSLILPQKSLSFLKTSFYFSFLHLFSSILYNESKKNLPFLHKAFHSRVRSSIWLCMDTPEYNFYNQKLSKPCASHNFHMLYTYTYLFICATTMDMCVMTISKMAETSLLCKNNSQNQAKK